MESTVPRIQRHWILWSLGVTIGLGPLVAQASPALPVGCYAQPLAYFNAGASAKTLTVCSNASFARVFCAKPVSGYRCEVLDLKDGLARLSKVPELQRANHPNRDVLAAYLKLMEWRGSVRKRASFMLQTGDYPVLGLSTKDLSKPCFRAILQAGYVLHRQFRAFNFAIDGSVKQCQFLIDGIDQLLQNADAVRRNVARIHSPMHTVFLGSRTKFNHFVMGEMGLHINVNKKGEIKKRLIEWQIQKGHIPHESGRSGALRPSGKPEILSQDMRDLGA